MRVDIVTIFPEYLAPLDLSLIGKARGQGRLDDRRARPARAGPTTCTARSTTPRTAAGPGMVMRPEPWGEALDARARRTAAAAGRADARPAVPFTQAMAHELAAEAHLVFACGRYEGIDQRVLDHAATRAPGAARSRSATTCSSAARWRYWSCWRRSPGCCPACSATPTRWSRSRTRTGCWRRRSTPSRPSWRGLEVPEVLRSGDHGQIARWRRDQALLRTAERRPDLLAALPPDGARQARPIACSQGVDFRSRASRYGKVVGLPHGSASLGRSCAISTDRSRTRAD